MTVQYQCKHRVVHLRFHSFGQMVIPGTLTPDSAGYYYVVVTDATGCTTYAGVNIREYDAVDQRANIWYFGQNAGIDFNEQPPIAITGPLNTPEGCSVISDRNGQLFFQRMVSGSITGTI
jgi:hypothetical protein